MKKGFIGIGILTAIAILSVVATFYSSYEVKKFINETETINLGAVTSLSDTINVFRTNVNATDEALRSTTSTDPGHLHTTAGISSTIAVPQGGTGLSTSSARGRFLISTGTGYESTSTLPVESGGTALTTSSVRGRVLISTGTGFETTSSVPVGSGGTSLTTSSNRGYMIISTGAGFEITSTIPVGSGGTGTSTATRYGVAVGSGTAPFEFVVPGANGEVLTSNGTSWISNTLNVVTTVTSTAGDDLNTNDAVYIQDDRSTTSTRLRVTGTANYSCYFNAATETNGQGQSCAQSFTPTSTYTTTEMGFNMDIGGTPSGILTFWLSADDANKPSSTILAFATTTATAISGTNANMRFNTSYKVASGTRYWIGASSTSPQSGTNYYALNGTTAQDCGGGKAMVLSSTSTWSDLLGDGRDLNCTLLSALIQGRVYQTVGNASSTSDSFLGFVNATTTRGNTVTITISGLLTNFNGLTVGRNYYISNTPGQISTTAGAVTRGVGIALPNSRLFITNVW